MSIFQLQKKYKQPFIATTPTRRANRERVNHSKYGEDIIRDNVRYLQQIRDFENAQMYIGGLMGCKGDAYQATDVLSEEDAKMFHSWQADLFKEAGADFLYAGIMPALSEAIGMAKAMEQTGLPYLISFMIQKNGRLIHLKIIGGCVVRMAHISSKLRKGQQYLNPVNEKDKEEIYEKIFSASDCLLYAFYAVVL